jgi:hypothetical protein
MATFKLLTKNNTKILKGTKYGYATYILHLAPSTLSGFNTCPMASAGCAAACLNTAGRGGMFKKGEDTNTIQKARIRKTFYFFNEREWFMMDLASDIYAAIAEAKRNNLIPVFRLNGTSDIRWENEPVAIGAVVYPNIMTAFPNVQFYDYTAIPNRRNIPPNYHLTFSLKENNLAAAIKKLYEGMNVAVVFGGKLPEMWNGYRVVPGDDSDLRFRDGDDAGPVVVGLTAKGRAKKDTSGFVQWAA